MEGWSVDGAKVGSTEGLKEGLCEGWSEVGETEG